MGKMYKVTGELLRNLAGTITNAAAIDRIVTVHFVDEIPQDIIASNEAAYRPSDQTIWIRKGATLPPMIANLVHELGHHAIKMREGGDAEHVAYDICARRVLELEAALAAAREEGARYLATAKAIESLNDTLYRCSGETLEQARKQRQQLIDSLCAIAALKSRSEGRVERAAAVMIKYKMKIPAKFKGLTWEVLARAVLAAADREGE